MNDDVAEHLHGLARDHAEGRLTLAAYRRLRAPLLDSLVGLAPEDDLAVTTQPRVTPARTPPAADRSSIVPAIGAEPVKPTEQVEPALAAVSLPLPPPAASRRVKTVAIILVLAAGIGSMVWLLRERLGRTSGPAAVSQSDITDSASLHALIQPLVDNPDWSDARLAEVNAALAAADPDQIAAAAHSDWFVAFADSVRRRLKEQQALSDAPLTPGSSPLAALAVGLGINLRAPDNPIRIVRETNRTPVVTPSRTDAKQTAGLPSNESRVPRPSRTQPSATQAVVPAAAPGTVGVVANPATPLNAGAESNAAPQDGAAHGSNCSAELSHARLPYCQDSLSFGGSAPRLAVVPSGVFQMGNATEAAERPVHSVTIPRPFAISVQELSQAEYRLFCQKSGKPCAPQPWSGDDYPVVETSWNDAVEYTRWLSKVTGERYRLPTESEWEYAARAGQTGLFPSGDALSPTDAYFSTGARLTVPAPRSQRVNANGWRLLNMVGNVREWVQDAWNPNFSGAPTDGSARTGGDPSAKVVRGGSYADVRATLRLTTRERLPTDARDVFTGIRIVRDVR